jgi:RNA polymerase sigma factor (sigma-70 family)
MKLTQNCWRSFASARIGKQLEAKKNQDQLDILSERDETLGSAVQSGLKRTWSWRVPPNWSRDDWLEELAAVATAAAWQALCDFDPELGVPLAAFGYCRIISRCLARYRKEWRYVLHIRASDSREEQTTTFKHAGLPSSVARVNGTDPSNNDLRGAVRALPGKQRRLIEQLFWEERTETEVANTMNINQSTINRRKRTILNSLRMKLCDGNEFQKLCIKLLVAGNLTDWLADLADVALGA